MNGLLWKWHEVLKESLAGKANVFPQWRLNAISAKKLDDQATELQDEPALTLCKWSFDIDDVILALPTIKEHFGQGGVDSVRTTWDLHVRVLRRG